MKISRIIKKGTPQNIRENTIELEKAFDVLGYQFLVHNIKNKNNKGKIDVYHISGNPGIIDLLKYRNGRYRQKIVFELTNTEWLSGSRSKIFNFSKYIKDSVYAKFTEIADVIVINKSVLNTLSVKENSEEALKEKVPELKNKTIFIIRNGFKVHSYKRIENRQMTIGFNIIFPNPIEKQSNIHCLVETLKYMSDDTCVFLTGIIKDETYFNEINGYIKNIKLENRVIFRKFEEIKEYQGSMSIGISLYDGDIINSGILPVLLSGIPVVTNVDYGYKIRGLYYADTDSGKNFSRAVKKYIREQDLSVDVPSVRKIFSWEARAEELVRIYKHMIING